MAPTLIAAMRDEATDWAQRLKQFVEYLQRERRVGPSAQHQYRSIVKDWIEFSLARGHDPAVFDQALAVSDVLPAVAPRDDGGSPASLLGPRRLVQSRQTLPNSRSRIGVG